VSASYKPTCNQIIMPPCKQSDLVTRTRTKMAIFNISNQPSDAVNLGKPYWKITAGVKLSEVDNLWAQIDLDKVVHHVNVWRSCLLSTGAIDADGKPVGMELDVDGVHVISMTNAFNMTLPGRVSLAAAEVFAHFLWTDCLGLKYDEEIHLADLFYLADMLR
jgi:hypothetical protein